MNSSADIYAVIWFADGQYQVPLSTVKFPDERFRACLSENFDSDSSGFLDGDECDAVEELRLETPGSPILPDVSFFSGVEKAQLQWQ